MFRERIIGVFKLNAAAFDGIGRDPGASLQAVLIVAVTAGVLALGSRSRSIFGTFPFGVNFLLAVTWTFASWLTGSASAYLIGSSIFGGQSSPIQVLRAVGFAYAPLALAIIPFIGALAGAIWSLAAIFVAIRQVLGLDNRKSLLALLSGMAVYMVVYFLISIILEAMRALLV